MRGKLDGKDDFVEWKDIIKEENSSKNKGEGSIESSQ
jgi:hypothetical protein